MDLCELKKLIKSNKIPNMLIFTGEEWMVQRIYIQQIAKVKKLSVVRADDVASIWQSINSKSLFKTNYVYVVMDDKEFMTTEKMYHSVDGMLGQNMLILVLSGFDKRLKFYKEYKDSYVEFNALESAILKRYIQKNILLSDRNAEILMEVCNYNYGHCLLEINKLKTYADSWKQFDDQTMDYNQIFEWLLDDGTIHIPPRDNIWAFIKAFLQNKPLEAYELWQDLRDSEVPVLSIISNLYTETKHVLQVQTCKDKDVSRITGLSGWQIKNAKECVGKFNNDDLEYIMFTCHKVEKGIKQGLISDDIAIDYIFCEIM